MKGEDTGDGEGNDRGIISEACKGVAVKNVL